VVIILVSFSGLLSTGCGTLKKGFSQKLLAPWQDPPKQKRKTLPPRLCLSPMALTHHVQQPPLPSDGAFCSPRGSTACIYRHFSYEKSEQYTPTPTATSPPQHKIRLASEIESKFGFGVWWWQEKAFCHISSNCQSQINIWYYDTEYSKQHFRILWPGFTDRALDLAILDLSWIRTFK